MRSVPVHLHVRVHEEAPSFVVTTGSVIGYEHEYGFGENHHTPTALPIPPNGLRNQRWITTDSESTDPSGCRYSTRMRATPDTRT